MIISIISNKGGVGKTATSINLAHALSNRGMRVLVIDQDSQCNTTSCLMPGSGGKSLKDVFSGDRDIASCIYPSKFEGVDILPNDPASSALEFNLYEHLGESSRLYIDLLRPYALANYDYTLIDCPPTLGLWLVMALAASDCAIVPVDAGSTFAIDGLITSISIINDIAARANPQLTFLRILINKADLRTSISKTLVDFIHRTFGDAKIFNTSIPYNTAIQQSELARTSVIRHAPASAGTKRFRELAEELIEVTGKRVK